MRFLSADLALYDRHFNLYDRNKDAGTAVHAVTAQTVWEKIFGYSNKGKINGYSNKGKILGYSNKGKIFGYSNN